MSLKCYPFCSGLGSDNGLSPGRRQAITWTNVGILLIGPLGTNFSEMLIEIHTFSFKKIHLKMSSGKWRRFCLGLNVLKFVPRGPVNKIPALVQIIAWHQPGAKPLSETMLVCFTDAYMEHSASLGYWQNPCTHANWTHMIDWAGIWWHLVIIEMMNGPTNHWRLTRAAQWVQQVWVYILKY